MARKICRADSEVGGSGLIFQETQLAGAFVLEVQRHEDNRGFFGRTFCTQEFAEHGLNPSCMQCNISFNARKGTLRGMHLQVAPHEEAKLVRCTMGAIHDVIVDLREHSETYLQHVACELSAENRRMLFVPEGFAHGFLTLTDSTEVFYQMSSMYVPGSASGFRHDDPTLNLEWPGQVVEISEQDRNWPDFQIKTRNDA